MSKICGRMGISSIEIERSRASWLVQYIYSLTCLLSCLLVSVSLAACTSVRPVVKIGLLAPFEGLHRRLGYEALAAMRQAIADAAPTTVAVMPLALDDGATPAQIERALRKLLQDSAVRAVIGPYHPVLAQQVAPLMAATDLPWLMPFAVDPVAGFVPPDSTGNWVMPLLAAAVQQAQRIGCQRLVIAGSSPEWLHLTDEQTHSAFGLPLVLSEQVQAVQPDDAVLWLGSPEAGAIYFSDLRALSPHVPFLLGPQSDSPIFSEHTQIIGPVYLLFWLDNGYEQWQARYPTASPTVYLTYRATQQAIARSLGQTWSQNQAWHVQIAPLTQDGIP